MNRIKELVESFPSPSVARITPEHVETVVVSESYYFPEGTTLTIAVLTLVNGNSVTGESACVCPDNYDRDIGMTIALKRAKEKVYTLEGYLLAEYLMQNYPEIRG
jgi:hypothetical protein